MMVEVKMTNFTSTFNLGVLDLIYTWFMLLSKIFDKIERRLDIAAIELSGTLF